MLFFCVEARVLGVLSLEVSFRNDTLLTITRKSTFYWKQLEPHGYARVNQDILKSVSANTLDNICMSSNICERDKCIRAAEELLEKGKSVVVGKSFISISLYIRKRTDQI